MTDIILPWPARCMWPNSRVDRRAAIGPRKKYRADGAKAAWAAGFRKLNWQSAHLRITFHPPCRRARDLDNMLAAIKSGLDGVSDAIGIDDSRWSMTIQRGPVVKGGAVHVALVPPAPETQFYGKTTA